MAVGETGSRGGLVAFIRRNQVAAFVLLAYALSWWAWVWYHLDPGNVGAPVLPMGPLLAALILLPIIGGWPALKDLFRRIALWRVGWVWYLVVLAGPVVLTLAAVRINLMLGAKPLESFQMPDAAGLAARFVFIFLWIGLGEEPGWRGFVLPRLLLGRSALSAALILGAIHTFWHLPLLGVEYFASNVLPWAVTVFCFSIVVAWIFQHTGGSVLMPMLIARELAADARRVTLAVGNHLRLPRRYRSADVLWWMDRLGLLDAAFAEGEAARLRRLPSLPLAGSSVAADLDLNALQDMGVEIVGRLSAIADGDAWFSGALANVCATADLKLDRLLARIDALANRDGVGSPARPPATRVPDAPRLRSRLRADGIGTMVWATGVDADHSWVDLPVFDAKSRIRHARVVVAHGLYVMGLRYLRVARSSHISGAERDANALADHLVAGLARLAAA